MVVVVFVVDDPTVKYIGGDPFAYGVTDDQSDTAAQSYGGTYPVDVTATAGSATDTTGPLHRPWFASCFSFAWKCRFWKIATPPQ